MVRGLRIGVSATLASVALALVSATVAGAQSPGTMGAVTSLPTGTQLFGVAVQSDGEVVVAGQSGGRMLVERFTTTGATDGTFLGAAGVARAVAIQPNGDVVLAGTSAGTMLVERLTTSLAPDPGFGSGGIVTAFAGQAAVANGVAIAPSGSIVAAGSLSPPNTQVAIAQFSASGAVQWSKAQNFGPYSVANAVAVQPDDKVVLVGSQTPSQTTNAVLARFNADGSLDGTFGGGAFTYTYPGGGYTSLDAVTIQNDGEIVAAGVDVGGPHAIFLRVNPNGSFDTSFGSSGVAALPSAQSLSINPGAPIGAYGVVIAGGGAIVGAGNFENTGTEVDAALWAFTPGGAPEASFGSGGTVRGPTGADEACALAVAPDGTLIAVGNTVTSIPDYTPCQVNTGSAGFVASYVGYGPPPPPATPRPTPPPTPPPPAPTGAAPTVSTGAVSAVTEVSATAGGLVDPDGLATSYHFDYGSSASYGASTPVASAGSASVSAAVSAHLTGLRPGTTYHYRIVASNAHGVAYGVDRAFTTTPRLRVRLSGLRRTYAIATIEKSGLRLTVNCNQPCRVRGSLVISAATAHRLGLGKRQLTIATGSASRKHAGNAKLRVRVTAKGRHALARVKRVRVTLRILVTPAGGGPRVVISRTVTLTG